MRSVQLALLGQVLLVQSALLVRRASITIKLAKDRVPRVDSVNTMTWSSPVHALIVLPESTKTSRAKTGVCSVRSLILSFSSFHRIMTSHKSNHPFYSVHSLFYFPVYRY